MGLENGRVIRFDAQKGFGFIAPDAGGADVFLHASAILGDPNVLRQGTAVEFEAIESDQGRKALTARAVRESSRSLNSHGDADADLCEVVSASEFMSEITDTLLAAAPSLTGTQIVDIRRRLTDYARDRRWLDD